MCRLLTIAWAIALALGAACGEDATTDASVADDAGRGDAAASGELDATMQLFGITAAVGINLAPDEACAFDPEAHRTEAFVATGSYDLSQSAARDCNSGYKLRLVVRARREPSASQEGTTLTILGGTIMLTTTDGVPLALDQTGGLTVPNPLVEHTHILLGLPDTGEWAQMVVPITVIPIEYTQSLRTVGVDRILASITVEATISTSEFLAIGPFEYPIDLCEGCLIKCSSTLTASGTTREEALAGACADEAAADGRLCIDDDC